MVVYSQSISLLMLSLNKLHSPTIGTKISLGISVDATSYSLKFTSFAFAANFALNSAKALLGFLLLELRELPQSVGLFMVKPVRFFQ